MKKYFPILFISLLGILSGCSKDAVDKPIDKSANLKGTGDSANDILSNGSFDRLLIEIAYVEGFRPAPSTLEDLSAFLKQHTFKDHIEFVYKSVASPNEETLTLKRIGELESEHRTVYNDGKTLAIYIYFADAPSDGDNEDEDLVTLGAVYRNTSMVIHEVTIRKLASQSILISNADVETATLNHEFGHLLGLVNVGSPSVNDHEDPEADNHCNAEICLMRGELQFGSPQGKTALQSSKSMAYGELHASCSLSGRTVMEMLSRNTSRGIVQIPGLDAECILDLRANGGR